jgi:hypothetical protein
MNSGSVSPIADSTRNINCIRLATTEDAAAITHLRQSSFLQSRDFKVLDPDKLAWGEHDLKGLVLSLWDRNRGLLSTTRGEVLRNLECAEIKMECRLKLVNLEFPCLLLGKGATIQEQGGTGFHSALRYCFLRAAIKTPLQSITGIVYEGASRTRLMQEIGYEFYRPDRFWYENLVSDKTALIAKLRRSQFESASAILARIAEPILNEYPLVSKTLAKSLHETVLAAIEN